MFVLELAGCFQDTMRSESDLRCLGADFSRWDAAFFPIPVNRCGLL
jgi:hypothetical protein